MDRLHLSKSVSGDRQPPPSIGASATVRSSYWDEIIPMLIHIIDTDLTLGITCWNFGYRRVVDTFSYYIAEIWNTVSSFAMVFAGILGIAYHYKHFEQRFLWSFAAVAVVGMGSALFHATLLFHHQMLDELPMIYNAMILTYVVLEQNNKRPKYAWLPYALALHSLIASVFVASPALAPQYASPILQFVSFHLTFLAAELFLLFKSIQIYRQETEPRMKSIYLVGLTCWCLGVGCWLLDYFGCEAIWEGADGFRRKHLVWDIMSPDWLYRLTGWEQLQVGIPNPQFHAWWHLFASTGLYFMTVTVARRRAQVLGHKSTIAFSRFGIPYAKMLGKQKEEDDSVVADVSAHRKSSATMDNEDQAVLWSAVPGMEARSRGVRRSSRGRQQ